MCVRLPKGLVRTALFGENWLPYLNYVGSMPLKIPLLKNQCAWPLARHKVHLVMQSHIVTVYCDAPLVPNYVSCHFVRVLLKLLIIINKLLFKALTPFSPSSYSHQIHHSKIWLCRSCIPLSKTSRPPSGSASITWNNQLLLLII